MVKNDLRIMDKADKRELVTRLSKIEGQIRAIINMIEKEESCDIVIHQLAAVKQAIHKTFTNAISKILENNCCININVKESEELQELKEKISSVSKLIEKYL